MLFHDHQLKFVYVQINASKQNLALKEKKELVMRLLMLLLHTNFTIAINDNLI